MGGSTYTTEGITKLCTMLKGSQIIKLKRVPRPQTMNQLCLCLSAPIDIVPHPLGSLGNNELCGVTTSGSGTYTTEGITKLCEALKGSAVTSLECAAAQ